MEKQSESRGELRAAHTMREIKNARRSIPMGSVGVFMRVTLALIFLYMVVISYSMLGIIGPVIVSILFLVAFFIPVLYQAVIIFLEQRRVRADSANTGEKNEVHQEG